MIIGVAVIERRDFLVELEMDETVREDEERRNGVRVWEWKKERIEGNSPSHLSGI